MNLVPASTARAYLAGLVVLPFLVAACAFELAEVVRDVDGGTTVDGGNKEGGELPDGSVLDAPTTDAPAIDAGPGFITIGQACTGSEQVVSLAVSTSTIFAVCSTTPWSRTGGASGRIVSAPRAGGTFTNVVGAGDAGDAGTSVRTGETLTANLSDLYFHGSCGISRLNVSNTETLVSAVAPGAFSAATLRGTNLYFAGAGAGGLWQLSTAGSCGADAGCVPDVGCTKKLGVTAGATMGIDTFDGEVYAYTCDAANHPALHGYAQTGVAPDAGTLPTSAFNSTESCATDVPWGLAALGGDLYFAVNTSVKQARKTGINIKVDEVSNEPDRVTLLTTDGTRLFWIAGQTLRRSTGGMGSTIVDTKAKVTAMTAVSDEVFWGTSTGEVNRTK